MSSDPTLPEVQRQPRHPPNSYGRGRELCPQGQAMRIWGEKPPHGPPGGKSKEKGRQGDQTRYHKAPSVVLSGSLPQALVFEAWLIVFGEEDKVGIREQGLGIG